ncbi:MAG TPA: FliA/WhiG family RNA polymerase sigma factor [Terriglobales bacterium]|nr:FliA/WhiG family RNA polymerase sigma factor [Terriglobales bacterium]
MTPTEEQYVETQQDFAERNQLILSQLQEVQFIARRIHERLPQSVLFEDLVHAGILGLMEATRNYDPRKNVQFKSYAQFRIRGAILDSLRRLDPASRRLRRRGRKLDEAVSSLSMELGRPPAEEEVAEKLGVTLLALRKLRRTLDSLETVGQTVAHGADRSGTHDLVESAPATPEESPFARCLNSEMRQHLSQAIRQLPEREQQVISLYYVEQLTMQEIATILDVRESRISQIHCAALAKLRASLEKKEIEGVRSFAAGA